MSSKRTSGPLGIYSARVLINPEIDFVTVYIRQTKKGKTKKVKLAMPESLIEEEMEEIKWSRYRGEKIITYQRKYETDVKYLLKNEIVPARLSQKLESLVQKAYNKLD